MIHLYMKQDYLSIKHNISVTDEIGKDRYLIVGKWGRVGDGFSLYDMNGDLIIEVKQTLLSLFPKFDLIVAGSKIASIKKYRGIKGPYFKVSQLKWVVRGDFENNPTLYFYFEKTFLNKSRILFFYFNLYCI